jgi:hypothetical protein
MHDSIVRSLIETAIELCEAEIPHARSPQDTAQLRSRMLILQGALVDIWARPEAMPPRLASAKLVEALRKIGA